MCPLQPRAPIDQEFESATDIPLREQLGKLTDALAAAERERDRWAEAHETVPALANEERPDPVALTRAPVTPAYPQIIAAFTGAGPLRAKEVCRVTGTGTDSRHVEGMRSELKKLVARGILAEPEAGVFVLAATAAHGVGGTGSGLLP